MINGYDYTFLNFSRVHSFPTFTLSMQLFCEQIEINIALTIWFNTTSITTMPTIHWFRIQGLRKDKGCLRCHPGICLFRIWIRISSGTQMELFSMPCWNGKFSVIPQNDPNECVHFPATHIILQTMNYSNWVTILWMVRKQKPRKNEAKCAMYGTK